MPDPYFDPLGGWTEITIKDSGPVRATLKIDASVPMISTGTWKTIPAVPRQTFAEAIGEFWCRRMHRRITRPVNNEYVCMDCQRRFKVGW